MKTSPVKPVDSRMSRARGGYVSGAEEGGAVLYADSLKTYRDRGNLSITVGNF